LFVKEELGTKRNCKEISNISGLSAGFEKTRVFF